MNEDSEVVKEYLDNIPDFSTLFDKKTTSEVQTILDGYMLDDEADAEETSSESKKFGTQATESGTNSVDKAFEELLG